MKLQPFYSKVRAFNAENTRRTSKVLGLRTEASGRYEKGVATETSKTGVERACQLVEMLGCGRVLKGIAEDYPTKTRKSCIKCKSI